MRIDYAGDDTEQTLVDPRIKAFLSKTPQEVEIYLDGAITDLASAKTAMKTMGMLLRVMASEVQKIKGLIKVS